MIKWGIIGCGEVTEIKSGPAFNKVPGSSLQAVMRRDPEKAKDYAARHQVASWYSDADSLVHDPEVNAIYIATPPFFHEQFAIAALKAGKPVYVEKPMAADHASAARMLEAMQTYRGKMCVAHYRRELPFFKKIKSLLDEKHIGEVQMVHLEFLRRKLPPEKLIITRNAWRVNPAISGGGLFYDLAPHQLDLMLYFFGEFSGVNGFSLNQSQTYAADDLSMAIIEFKNGLLFNGTWCFNHNQGDSDLCTITGTAGTLSFPVFGKQKVTCTTANDIKTFEFEPPEHIQLPLISKIVKYFLDEGPDPSPAENGVSTLELMDRITGKLT